MTRLFLNRFGQMAFLMMLIGAIGLADAQAQDLTDGKSTNAEASGTESLWGNGARGIEGTWQAQTTIRNCQTGTVMENFSKLASFNMGGTAQETSSSSILRTAALGIWEHNRGDSFRYLLRFFRFNADGTPAGSIRALWNVTLGDISDSYAAEGTIQVLAPNGNVVATLCGTETATRLAFPD